MKGKGNSYGYEARIYDPRVGRWLTKDPYEGKYPSLNPYNFVANTPLIATDPDGRKIYFIGGAGNDSDGWEYIHRFITFFKQHDMEVFRIDASGGKMRDVLATSEYRLTPKVVDIRNSDPETPEELAPHLRVVDVSAQVKSAFDDIMKDIKSDPKNQFETLDLMGYSYGSVVQAHVALALADEGIVVDNLILVGSPIPTNSELFEALESNPNIKNVIRKDIDGDLLSNPSDPAYIAGGIQNAGDSGPHFDLARPGAKADKKIDALASDLKLQGVGNPGVNMERVSIQPPAGAIKPNVKIDLSKLPSREEIQKAVDEKLKSNQK